MAINTFYHPVESVILYQIKIVSSLLMLVIKKLGTFLSNFKTK